MKKELVNEHVLPPRLAHMIAEGRWGPSCRTADLSTLPIEDKDDLVLLQVSEMVRNTYELRAALARGDGELFALIEDGPPVPGFLDINKAVVIAVTHGEEVLALDYSVGEEPRVVATHYEPGNVKWVEVAQSFDELLNILKLSAI
jgi:hypothetical protein